MRVTRLAAMFLTAVSPPAAPPGISATAYADALAEDTYEVLAGLAGTHSAVVAAPGQRDRAQSLVWPGTPVLVADGPLAALGALLAEPGGDGAAAVVVCCDAPDLPQLLVGKLFAALAGADVACCPGERGDLVALAARAPLTEWLLRSEADLDTAASDLQRRAPPGALVITPGWHRLREPATVARLDPGLEGWPATRALLGG